MKIDKYNKINLKVQPVGVKKLKDNVMLKM